MNEIQKHRKKSLQLSLSEEFAIISFLILFIGMIVVGWWLGREIKQAVFQQTVQTTKLFVDSFYSNLVKELATEEQLNKDSLYIIDSLSHNSPIGEQFAFINIWSKSGTLAYSSNPNINSGKAPFEANDVRTGREQVNWELYSPAEIKSHLGIEFKDELLEIILPIHRARSDDIFAIVELYFYTDELRATILNSQLRSMFLLSVVTLFTMILLYTVVRRGNRTIWMQQSELEQRIMQLSDLVDSNQKLHSKALNATYKTAEVSEKLLRRISAELHDSPAQCLGYALLKIDLIFNKIKVCDQQSHLKKQIETDMDDLQNAISDALKDIRSLSTRLSMPELEGLSIQEIIERVINIHQRRTSTLVTTNFTQALEIRLSMALLIGIYRFVQEALNNAYLHGQGINQQVMLEVDKNTLKVEVSDQGPGFDINKVDSTGDHLGLIGIRERIESLGGSFELTSVIGQGTSLCILIPYK